jgi:hypothetical protein
MPSDATLFRRSRGAKINREGTFAMVSCKRCAKHKPHPLSCKLSSLSTKCGNCESVGAESCVPVDIPPPDFSKIESELSKVEAQLAESEQQAEKDEAEAEAAWLRMKAAREKSKRLRKQHKFLKRKEQKLFDKGLSDVQDLEALESVERLNQELSATNPTASMFAHTVDWSDLFDPIEGPSGSLVSCDSDQASHGNL